MKTTGWDDEIGFNAHSHRKRFPAVAQLARGDIERRGITVNWLDIYESPRGIYCSWELEIPVNWTVAKTQGTNRGNQPDNTPNNSELVDAPMSKHDEEQTLQRRFEHQLRVRFGSPKTISVLQRVVHCTEGYEQIVRSYKIEQPRGCDHLSPLYPISEVQLLTDSAYALVGMVGLQRAVEELQKADPQDVPEIRYQILRESESSNSVSPLDFSECR